MPAKSVLYISGSFGLGHVNRDLAIAAELRRLNPEVQITWLAAEPASTVLRQAGETLAPEADSFGDDSAAAEASAQGQRLNLMLYTLRAQRQWRANVAAYARLTRRQPFDLVVADEAYELGVAMMLRPGLRVAPFVMIYDFVGFDPMSWNPLERLATYFWNSVWANDARSTAKLFVFVGELEDIPDHSLGPGLPNRRQHARRHYHPVGYILPFDPASLADRSAVRARLGYSDEPLVICSIGGTAIGKELLELCGRAYPLLRTRVPALRMILVTGPRLAPQAISTPAGVEVRGYVPGLHEHLAASDLAVVQGGGTITLELTALRRPFLYFPREGDYEQGIAVAGRVARHGAGVRMTFSRTSPEALAEQVLANLGKEVSYPPIPTDGARKAAELISGLLASGF